MFSDSWLQKKVDIIPWLLCSIPSWALHHLLFLLFLERFFFWQKIPKRFYSSITLNFATEHYHHNTSSFFLCSAGIAWITFSYLVNSFAFLPVIYIIMGKLEPYHLKTWVLILALLLVLCSVFLIYKYWRWQDQSYTMVIRIKGYKENLLGWFLAHGRYLIRIKTKSFRKCPILSLASKLISWEVYVMAVLWISLYFMISHGFLCYWYIQITLIVCQLHDWPYTLHWAYKAK